MYVLCQPASPGYNTQSVCVELQVWRRVAGCARTSQMRSLGHRVHLIYVGQIDIAGPFGP